MFLYVTRFALMTFWFFGVSLVVLALALLRPFRVENGTRFCRWIAPGTRALMGLRLVLRNGERLDSSQPCIFIANHQSLIDLFVIGAFFPDRTVTIGKKSLVWVPVFGWLYWLSAQIFIDRSSNERAVATMQDTARKLARGGLSVFLFPEGTRTHGGPMLPFKKGAFHLALATGLPLQPMVVSPMHKHLDFRKRRSGTVILEMLEPIPATDRSPDQADALLVRAQREMGAAFERLDDELSGSRPR